jgi:hypothetical protein
MGRIGSALGALKTAMAAQITPAIWHIIEGEDPNKDFFEPRHGWRRWKTFEVKGEVKRNGEEAGYLDGQVALRLVKQTRRVYRIQQTFLRQ